MQTDNCAIVTPDVLVDLSGLLDSRCSATPAEFHALNSLVEAVVFHEKLYIYDLSPNCKESELYIQLVKEKIIHSESSAEMFETELKSRGMDDVARDVLLDRAYGLANVSYHVDDGVTILSSLVEYEKNLGFDRMSRMRDSTKKVLVPYFASTLNFSEEDTVLVDDTYRRARAFSVCATELDLEMYTGIVMRPFVLGFLSARRRGALGLYEKMLEELDDVEDTDLPSWKRFEIPPLSQVLLRNCQESPEAIINELLKLRKKLSKFRKTLSDQAINLKNAKSRGEKRKVRRETEKAWGALLEKQDQSTRLSHQMWRVVKNPLSTGDMMIEHDKLDQAILKVQGLTDLWRVIYNAPTIEQNIKLVKNLFKIDIKRSQWDSMAQVVNELETIMSRNTEPNLPSVE